MGDLFDRGRPVEVWLNRPEMRDESTHERIHPESRRYQFEVRVCGVVLTSVWLFGKDKLSEEKAREIAEILGGTVNFTG